MPPSGKVFRLEECSNRTIVGLKVGWIKRKAEWKAKQQSHHCGIERVTAWMDETEAFVAAIAPLWD